MEDCLESVAAAAVSEMRSLEGDICSGALVLECSFSVMDASARFWVFVWELQTTLYGYFIWQL